MAGIPLAHGLRVGDDPEPPLQLFEALGHDGKTLVVCDMPMASCRVFEDFNARHCVFIDGCLPPPGPLR